jgi:hypothetical protein
MSDQQKTYGSQEMTAVLPRDCLPPPSHQDLDELDLDPTHPETVSLRVRVVCRHECPTMIPCPRCGTCACCDGARLVTVERAASWRASSEPSDDAA